MTLSGFVAYIKQLWANKPNTSSPLSAERLNHIEEGIKTNSDGIEALATAVITQITNDPNKIASMAALYSVKQAVDKTNSDLIAAKTDLAGKQSKAWTLLGAAWGNGHSTLPADATEIFCEVRVLDNILHSVTFSYPIMPGDTRMYHGGGNDYQAGIVAAGRTIYMQYATEGSDVTSSSTIYIYYR